MKIPQNKILVVTFLVIIIHFVLTSAIGHYIGNKVGEQMGQVVAQGLIDASESNNKSDAKVGEIHQGMKKNGDEIIKGWKVPSLLISLPVKPLINPFFEQYRKNRIKQYISKDISREQFHHRALMTDYILNFINSLTLGFFVYIMMKIFKRYRRKT